MKSIKSAELRQFAITAIPVLAAVGFVGDLLTKRGIDDWVWYFVALTFTVFLNKRPLPFIMAGVFSVLTLIGHYLSSPGNEGELALINCFMGIGMLWIMAGIIFLRQRAEAAWQESETHYHFLFKNMQTGFAHCRMVYKGEKPDDFIYVSVNPAFERIIGLHEVVGKRVTDVIPGIKAAHPELFEIYGHVASTGTPRKFEYCLETSKVWLSVSAYSPARGYFVTIFENITERKRAEGEAAVFRALIDRSNDGIEVVEPASARFHDINEITCQRLGYKREELLSMYVPDIVPNIKHEDWPQIVDDLRQRRAMVVEACQRRKDGTTFPIEASVRWVELEREYIVVVVRDITERKEAEDELRKLSTAVQQSPASVVITNAAGNIEYVNPKFCQLTGYSASEVLGKNPRILKSGEMSPADYREMWKTITSGRTWHGEFHNRKKNGELYWELAAISPIVDDSGKATHYLAVKEDITGRKRAENELVWKTAFLEAQLNSSPDAILVVDNQGKRILENQRLIDLFRVPREITQSNDDAGLLQHVTRQMKNPEQFLDRVRHLYAHPDEIGRDEIELSNGTILDRYSSPVRGKDGKHYGRIWAFRDITERRKLEAQFLQAQKMEGVGQLAGGVAHDFNNILGVIEMQAGLLRNSNGLSATDMEFADEISSAVHRAAALVRQLLLFSRREVFQPRDLDLSESVASTAKMLRRILGDTIQMDLRLAPQPMFAHADPGMMDQVLMNLTVNARDAMPNGGRLVIETSGVELSEAAASKFPHARPGAFVCLSVTDNGCGIPNAILPRIFEPFFTTKEAGKGTGLGLATVFGIMEQHRGWVEVQSEAGSGTTFRIYLPRLHISAAAGAVQPGLKDMQGGEETILLVEDDPCLRRSTRMTLSQLGYRILEAPTGVKALDVWKENRNDISLLLTDVVMPGEMTGKALAQTILGENPRLKVVYISGYSVEVSGGDFPLREDVNFLPKPFYPAKLAKIIRHNLDRSALREAEAEAFK